MLRFLHWRDLLLELVLRDLKIRYQRSALGIGWSLMKPLSQLIVFAFVFNSVVPLNIPNYTSFVFVGVLAWSWLGSSLTSAAVAITGNAEMVRRPGFPLHLLPLLTVVANGVHFVLALPILLVFASVETGFPGISLLALPLVILLQLLLTLGVSYFIAAAHVYFRDTQHVVGIVVMLGFYVTPVFYRPITAGQDFAWLTHGNPVAWLLEAYRAIFLYHQWPAPSLYAWLLGISLPLLILGAMLFNHVSRRFAEEL
jgi:lipopolysaccharide transport system permease protein